ncbi:F-box protein At-B [Actinidia eriantha]|uniref:F-box protein At-B n=1 Tax=Actinidia eriantha TaxID=165200 RepID=UPI002587F12C|nr:F-box protein At-B [Actinidia eriantha]
MHRRRPSGGGDVDGGGGDSLMERLPFSIINEILEKLEVESLCSSACACRTLHSSASQVLSSLSTLDLSSSISPDVLTLNRILYRLRGLKSLTLDCLRLGDSSVCSFLGDHIQELNLLKGLSLSYHVLASIGRRCPNLRVLGLELIGRNSPKMFKRNLLVMLKSLSYLESLCIKVRGTELDDAYGFQSIELSLPKTIKILKLQPLLVKDAIQLIRALGDGGNFLMKSTNLSPGFRLQSLSLALNIISDNLMISITNSLHFLVELDLEDRPTTEPLPPYDLTNTGLQSLGSCQHLTGLSLVRKNHPISFKRVTDMGMFLLSECCKGLESVRLGGFSKVSDAGFAAILHSCHNLKKFEVRNASLLSDLTFHDICGAPCSLLEVKLWSCNLITSESVTELADYSNLEVLDLSGCRSIADSCLSCISSFYKLTTLNLEGADVTDGGLEILGKGNSPITRLCLRGCKRISDKGIDLLVNSGGKLSKTLSALDMGYLPGISDKAIFTIASFASSVTELCIRNCFYVTDASMTQLASRGRFGDGKKFLRRLDVFDCRGLSDKLLELLKKPSFRGLQWLGVGSTRLTGKGKEVFNEICNGRPWLTLCLEGCEMGCHDGWHFHF